jgi:molybdopterin-guanine dinucleotide biosynthesis protein B
MNVAALIGSSGAGKSTLITSLITRYVREGKRVGAIKRTHHPLNEENRGDTTKFRAAGADPVILAGMHEAVLFRNEGTTRVRYERPRDLLAQFGGHDIVLVEGFKETDDWPVVTIAADARPTVDELAANLDRIWNPT